MDFLSLRRLAPFWILVASMEKYTFAIATAWGWYRFLNWTSTSATLRCKDLHSKSFFPGSCLNFSDRRRHGWHLFRKIDCCLRKLWIRSILLQSCRRWWYLLLHFYFSPGQRTLRLRLTNKAIGGSNSIQTQAIFETRQGFFLWVKHSSLVWLGFHYRCCNVLQLFALNDLTSDCCAFQ